MKRKITAMHEMYGYSNNQCANCKHFKTYNWRGRNYFKCAIYGDSNSEATDWRKSYIACGLFNKDTNEKKIYKILQHSPKKEEQIVGQISIIV